jgi:uncharacterized protein YkwD
VGVAAKLSPLLVTLAFLSLPVAASDAAAVGVAGQRVVAAPRNGTPNRIASPSQTAASSASPLVAPAAACPGQNNLGASPETQEQAMECMIDFARRRVGLSELTEAAALHQSAANKVADVFSCDSFSHFACGREFTYWIEQAGYMSTPCWHVGENLAWGAGEYGSARAIFIAWMRSPAHRDNLLGDYADTGISVQVGELGGRQEIHVWAAHFGSHCG